ncbi:hypothetical protein MGH68_12415 [Erysipelothrix sp. D19-032]
MAAANAMLYNDGKYIKPHTVVRIEFEDGSAPYVPSTLQLRLSNTEPHTWQPET